MLLICLCPAVGLNQHIIHIHCSGAVTGVLMHMQKVNRKVTALIDM